MDAQNAAAIAAANAEQVERAQAAAERAKAAASDGSTWQLLEAGGQIVDLAANVGGAVVTGLGEIASIFD